MNRRYFLRAGACGAAAGVLGLAGHAQQPAAPPVAPAPTRSKSGAEFINQETQTQIERGLEFLARNQYNDGSFPGGSVADDRRGTGGTGGWSVGVTSIAALALMAGGHQPGRGKYGKNVAKAVEYVASMAGGPTPGFLTTVESQTVGRLASYPSPSYSHGFGALFLAEVCGMHPATAKDAKVRGALEQAVEFTVKAQNREGGWRYEPLAQYADVSVTVAQMMALRAARNAGLFVRKTVMDNAAAYVKACQLPDGGFSYFKGQGYSAFARSAAALVGLYSAGVYEGREVERGLRYLQQFTPGRQFSPRELLAQHYWYAQYYAALAMWTAGDDYWTTWLPAIRDELLTKAKASGGSWTDMSHGSSYATAMALIVLQLPNNYLPILQK